MRILGVNAIFHDPAAAVVVDGEVVAAAEEERFSRRKHGKRPVPFSAWELPELAARWCLEEAGLRPEDVDALAYSYDPGLVRPGQSGLDANWEPLRTEYARRAPAFLANALPGLDPAVVQYVPHHVAHAASAGLAAPFRDSAVLVADGRGEAVSHLAGRYRDGELTVLATQELPHSLGLLYEAVTSHLGGRHGPVAADACTAHLRTDIGCPPSLGVPRGHGRRVEPPGPAAAAARCHRRDGAGAA
jgi:carbamoyltransferase